MIDQADFKEVLEQHKFWLSDNGGNRADLSRANLSRADLSWANLSGANLSRADLSWANLSSADLSRANLNGANLSRANLSGVDLSGADLSGANLSWASLSGANLSGVDLIAMQLNQYRVFVQKEFTRIGCEYHKNEKWLGWTPADVAHMAPDAEKFWAQYKIVVCAAIQALKGEDKK